MLTRVLYNYVTFAVQRRLHQLGIPFVIVPVPVSSAQVPRTAPPSRARRSYRGRPRGRGHRRMTPYALPPRLTRDAGFFPLSA